MSARHGVFALLLLAAISACSRHTIGLGPAGESSTRGSLDDLCRDAGPDTSNAPLDTFQVGDGLIAFEKKWFVQPRQNSHKLDLSLGIRGTIAVTHDLQRTFPRVFAPSGIECEIVRGIDTVLIRGRIENRLGFSVEALWGNEGSPSEMYLYMTTAIPDELRKIRRAIETARFPVPDSVALTGR